MTIVTTKVLFLIDNDESFNYINQEILEELDASLEVKICSSAKEALDLIRNEGCPNLILLDVNMPGCDGFDFLKQFESMNRCSTPVIMLTSSTRKEDQEKVKEFKSVIDYVEKPFELKDTRLLFQNILKKVS